MIYDEKILMEICVLLGLSENKIDYLKTVLNQMEVKGVITIEECRRFGELIPGSIWILSKTLGVDTVMTFSMLKNRRVFYNETINPFLENILKTYTV